MLGSEKKKIVARDKIYRKTKESDLTDYYIGKNLDPGSVHWDKQVTTYYSELLKVELLNHKTFPKQQHPSYTCMYSLNLAPLQASSS